MYFRKSLKKTYGSIFQNVPYYLVVLTDNQNDNDIEMMRIFQTAFDNNVMNINILMQGKNTSVWSINMYKAYQNDCRSVTKYTVATFTRENYTSEMNVTFNELFPQKLSDLNGCTVKVSTFPYEPFVIVRTKGYNDSIYEFDGIEVTIFENIAKRMNFKPQYLLPADGKNRGVIFDNGTANGCMQMVITRVFSTESKYNSKMFHFEFYVRTGIGRTCGLVDCRLYADGLFFVVFFHQAVVFYIDLLC